MYIDVKKKDIPDLNNLVISSYFNNREFTHKGIESLRVYKHLQYSHNCQEYQDWSIPHLKNKWITPNE